MSSIATKVKPGSDQASDLSIYGEYMLNDTSKIQTVGNSIGKTQFLPQRQQKLLRRKRER